LANSFVLEHSGDAIETTNAPQEEQHWWVARAFLAIIIQNLHDYVERCVAKLVFNLHEIGILDWGDRKMKKVIVPAAMLGQPIHHGISRNVKHFSLR
jgi:hypothetical protein